MPEKPTGVEFIHAWRGRAPGETDSALDYGVAHQLVQRGIAKWRQATEPRSKRRERSKLSVESGGN